MKVLVRTLAAAAFLACLAVSVPAADERCGQCDPLQRNLVTVEGGAEITVPVNCFELKFSFETDGKSFTESANRSAQIISAVQAGIAKLNIPEIEIIKGWDYVKQSKISFGDSGRKLSNVFTIRARNFPEGKLHELISLVIDTTLAANKDIVLSETRSYLSEDLEAKKREEAVTAALKVLQVNAEKAAAALGRKAATPKRVYTAEEGLSRELDMVERATRFSTPSFSLHKSFSVNTQVVDRVTLKARVAGVYQIE